ncbi:hypothetical protein AJ79_01825 [Helicocarpus griseus UAMH5409]|uniref:MARVEL domain-containing protein n=1 Tax=Helicocarpus griseus UAMH5409 TaxID=1447875 RepID=A0A2B7Y470_9EURO|nr:hypothetical protein AJ79_01825 [Helicocarpus griseus UAMH5409]
MNFKKLVFDGIKSRAGVGSNISTIIQWVLRFLQFVFGIAVIGLYAQDLVKQRKAGDPYDPKWMYATALGTIASISAAIYFAIPFIPSPIPILPRINLPTLVYDSILSILWLTLFGIFGKIYITQEAKEDDKNLIRMKHAVWVDLANLALWTVTAAWAGMRWWRSGKGKREAEKESDMSEV